VTDSYGADRTANITISINPLDIPPAQPPAVTVAFTG
jgi:hypothetical protein